MRGYPHDLSPVLWSAHTRERGQCIYAQARVGHIRPSDGRTTQSLVTVAGHVWSLLLGMFGQFCWACLVTFAGQVWSPLLGRFGHFCWARLVTFVGHAWPLLLGSRGWHVPGKKWPQPIEFLVLQEQCCYNKLSKCDFATFHRIG